MVIGHPGRRPHPDTVNDVLEGHVIGGVTEAKFQPKPQR